VYLWLRRRYDLQSLLSGSRDGELSVPNGLGRLLREDGFLRLHDLQFGLGLAPGLHALPGSLDLARRSR
jgi:hypothetical protein